MSKPRGRPDSDEVDRFWRRFLAPGLVDRSTPTRDSWLADHEAFFRRRREEFDPEMATVFERFEVLYIE